MKKSGKLIGAGLLTAIASSLCCITPILALLSGTSGIASTFSWMEPLRPYLIAFTVLVLGFAWYQKLKPKKEIECDCEMDEQSSFMQSKLFLGIVTVFAIVMTAFPYYSAAFYPKQEVNLAISNKESNETIHFGVKGMTCTSCEQHINHSVNQLNGIVKVNASYENGDVEIEYNPSEITISALKDAINSTGYSVIK